MDNRWFEGDDSGLPTLTMSRKQEQLVPNGKHADGTYKGKHYTYLDMYLDYDSDEEEGGLPPEPAHEYHPCMDGEHMRYADSSDKEDAEDRLEDGPEEELSLSMY